MGSSEAHADWKDVATANRAVQDQLRDIGLEVDPAGFVTNRGVTRFFDSVDRIIGPLGFEIVEHHTDDDTFTWTIENLR